MKVYIGYDPREEIAAQVCASSLRQTGFGGEIRFLGLNDPDVAAVYKRECRWEDNQRYDVIDGKPFSTDFSFSRFLVPYLNGYQGWAMFVDCDFLFRDDAHIALEDANRRYAMRRALYCVQHDHRPSAALKMDGQAQTVYPRKNWSSLMLFNCGHPAMREMTPNDVNTRPGSWLHRFEWLADEDIGELPLGYNYLVGHNRPDQENDPLAVHFTEGGPWWADFQNVEYADEWRKAMFNFQPWR